MNRREKICQSYQTKFKCFQNIPAEFKFDGSSDDDCSFIFPPGYSMYVEEFTLNDPGPDNFVLDGDTEIEYKPKLKWQNRIQTWWSYLDERNPLNKKLNQRFNACIKKLKVEQYDKIFLKNKFFYLPT